MVADTLSGRYVLLGVVNFRLLGFELIEEYYKHDVDFQLIIEECSKDSMQTYVLQDDFLFKMNGLCISFCSIRGLLVREAHEGGIV